MKDAAIQEEKDKIVKGLPQEILQENGDQIAFWGELKKKNYFKMQQKRHLVLLNDGYVKYYKDGRLFKGSFLIMSNTKIIKTCKNEFEIVNPERIF